MIRVTEIDSLLGLVGFRQSTLSGYTATLDVANIASSSGLYVNDVSGLLTTKNMKAVQEDPAISDANFNTLLKNRMKASFLTLVQSVFSDNDLLENAVLYPYECDWNAANLLTNATDFVGYEFDPAKMKDLGVVINQLILEFSAVQAVKVLVFHSSKNALHTSQSVTTIANTAKHTTVGWNLPAFNAVAGGKWYIGYLRSGLTGQAYTRDYKSANIAHQFRQLDIRPIQVSGWNAETLFDVNDIEYVDETFGMNFDISTFRDFTSLIVQNKNRFARALQLQTAADILNLMATTARSNQDERYIKAEALYELNGNRSNPEIPQSVGVLNQLKDEIKKLKAMFAPPKIQINTMR